MTKFVASIIAGLIATVAGGLILDRLINQKNQEGMSQTTTPVPGPGGAYYFPTRADAERACGSNNVFESIDGKNTWPFPGPYMCFRLSN